MNVIISAKENGIFPYLTIHDCFGTHPNLMESLYFLIRLELISIYSNESFLASPRSGEEDRNFMREIFKQLKIINL